MKKQFAFGLIIVCTVLGMLSGCSKSNDSSIASQVDSSSVQSDTAFEGTPTSASKENPIVYQLGFIINSDISFSENDMQSLCEKYNIDYEKYEGILTRELMDNDIVYAIEDVIDKGCTCVIFCSPLDSNTTEQVEKVWKDYPDVDFFYSTLQTYDIDSVLSRFSNGFAQMSYNDGTKHYCVVDENGEIKFTTNYPLKYCDIGNSGFSCYYADAERMYVFIDADGVETFTLAENDDTSYSVLAQGDDVFVIYETTKDFSGQSMFLYFVDGYGQRIMERYELEGEPRYVYYLGEKIFYVLQPISKGLFIDHIIYNLSSNAVFPAYGMDFEPLYNGIGYTGGEDSSTRKIIAGSYTASDLNSKEAWDTWKLNQNETSNRQGWTDMREGCVRIAQQPRDKWSEFYDYIDGVTHEYPQYPSGVRFQSIGDFSDGFCPLLLKGADNRDYITTIDKQGIQQYEPFRLPEISRYLYYMVYGADELKAHTRTDVLFASGKFVYCGSENDSVSILDSSGNSNETTYQFSDLTGYDGTYLYYSSKIINVETGKIIDKIYIPVN